MTPSLTGGAKDENLAGFEIKSSAEKISVASIWRFEKSRRSLSWQGRWIFYPRMNLRNANKWAVQASMSFRDSGVIGPLASAVASRLREENSEDDLKTIHEDICVR